MHSWGRDCGKVILHGGHRGPGCERRVNTVIRSTALAASPTAATTGHPPPGTASHQRRRHLSTVSTLATTTTTPSYVTRLRQSGSDAHVWTSPRAVPRPTWEACRMAGFTPTAPVLSKGPRS